ncbi:MAG: DEAD/DEAH box helicase [Methylobacter sp.]|nr:DEAD/DEAH box helicase [Methylobacter sp.]
MQIILSNKIHLTGLSPNESTRIKTALTFANPKFAEAQKFNRSTWNIDRNMQLFEQTDSDLVIPRGIALDRLGVTGSTVDNRHERPVKFETSIKPRPYQERVIRLARANDNGVIVAPTGSGKTTMGIELASRLGQRCLILVKSKDLAKQWQAAIKQFTGLDCGLIGGGKNTEGEQFTVGLVQTLVKLETALDYGLVIVDECHNIPADQAYKVINRQAAKYRYGLSATPQRRDNLEMMIHAALGAVIAEVEPHEVVGSVLPVAVTARHYNFQGNPESWSEFINMLAADEVRNTMLIGSAIKSSRNVGTAVLTGTIAHAETLTSLAKEYGVNALLLHGQLPAKLRAERMAAAPDTALIIGTLSLLSEGIDWPHVGAIIFAAPVSAEPHRENPAATRLLQSIGRGRRPYPGKAKTVVLDIIDNCPFGKAAYRKRSEIYRLQGFSMRTV